MRSFGESLARAQHRVDTLSKLDAAFGGSSKSSASHSTLHTPSAQAPTSTSAPSESKYLKPLLNLVGDNTEKTYAFFSSTLHGKSIVLDNTKSQIDANKSSTRLKNQSKRRKFGTSNTQLKKLGKVAMDYMSVPSLGDLIIVNSLWQQATFDVVKSCQSGAQLQARVASMELIGANACIIPNTTNLSNSTSKDEMRERNDGSKETQEKVSTESRKRNRDSVNRDERMVGIITAVTSNCYYICCAKSTHASAKSGNIDIELKGETHQKNKPKPTEKVSNDKSSEKSDKNVKNAKRSVPELKIHRVMKNDTTIAILLPDKSPTLPNPQEDVVNWNDVVSAWNSASNQSKVCILPATKTFFIDKRAKRKVNGQRSGSGK